MSYSKNHILRHLQRGTDNVHDLFLYFKCPLKIAAIKQKFDRDKIFYPKDSSEKEQTL